MFIAFDTPAAGTTASATTSAPSTEAVRAKVIQCASINCPADIGGILEDRSIIIERLDKTDTVLSTAEYAVPSNGGRDRTLTFSLDVVKFPGAKVRARFNTASSGEIQWVLINYDYRRVR